MTTIRCPYCDRGYVLKGPDLDACLACWGSELIEVQR